MTTWESGAIPAQAVILVSVNNEKPEEYSFAELQDLLWVNMPEGGEKVDPTNVTGAEIYNGRLLTKAQKIHALNKLVELALTGQANFKDQQGNLYLVWRNP